jgi:hypothetical protein
VGVLDRARGRRRTRPQARVVVASGVRITRQNVDAVRHYVSGKAEWQAHAWAYRDLIGELREGLQYQCRAVGRVAFMPAQINPNADEPWLLDADECDLPPALREAAVEELNRLPIDSMTWKQRLAENLAVVGEAWLHGHSDPRDPDGEVWDVRSVDEVEAGMSGGFSLNNGGNRPDEVDLDTDDLLRLWQPHPARYWHADSALRALLDVCEDIVLIGKELRAASRSRIAANGFLLFPDGMMLRSTRQTAEGVSTGDDRFAADLLAQVTSSISNEGDPGAVMPAIITGDVDDLQHVRHVEIAREDSPSLIAKLDKALARLGSGMDIPAEIITGMADANHWTAWQISTETFRHHIEPLVRIVDDALAEGYLREALLAREEGFDPALVAKVTVWHDAGTLTENPNRGDDAIKAYDRGAIGFDSLRQALGFADGDKPEDDEFVRMIAWKAGIQADLAAEILRAQVGAQLLPQGAQPRVIEARPADDGEQQPDSGPGQTGRGPRGGGDGQDPADPVPEVPADVQAAVVDRGVALVQQILAASYGGREFRVPVDVARDLADLERATRQRLAAECDAAVRRAVERAGSRVTSHTNGRERANYRAAIEAQPDRYPTAVLGRETVTAALGLDEARLLADAWDALYPRFARIMGRAVVEAARLTGRLLGLTGRAAERSEQRIVDDMTGRIDPAWNNLRERLDRAAEHELFDPLDPDADPTERDGEGRDLLVTEQDIREAMAEIGGFLDEAQGAEPQGVSGLTTGSTVTREVRDHGGETLGFEWHYGITPRPRSFEPHHDLHMRRFPSFTDPALSTVTNYGGRYTWVGPFFRPGDHTNCSCDYMRVWAIPEHAEAVDDEVARDRPQMRLDRWLAEDDDRQPGGGYPTGRTTAQQDRDERDRVRALQREYITEWERT